MMLRGSFGRTDLIIHPSRFQNGKHTLTARVLGVGGHDLVLRRDLPREADRSVLGKIMVEGLPAQVGLVEHTTLSLVVVIAHLIDGPVLNPAGREEPQLVLLDRAAQPAPDVMITFHGWGRVQATSPQRVVHIVTRQARAGVLGT